MSKMKESKMEKDSLGNEHWYDEEGMLHRLDGPAVIRNKGIKGEEEREWYCHGKKHRVNGPAIETPWYTEYWVENALHREGGPSIVYHEGNEDKEGEGQKLWHLHGVKVPQKIAESSMDDFDRSYFFDEDNVEIKREIIRRFGMERIFKEVDKKNEGDLEVGECFKLDEEKENNYELLRGRLTEDICGTYLKMKNPSIGVHHLECVPHEITTVNDALVWRNGGLKTRPLELT